MSYGARRVQRTLRVPFDLPIAVAVGFFGLIRHLKVRIPLQRRTLALLQIQMDRSAADRRFHKVTPFKKGNAGHEVPSLRGYTRANACSR
ncbi:hypothetical protein [Paenibacillus polymyxa]|uniref:hypothetical protein n=1 Tax=Paenibacillus polymyxa TaxID=1406 RepID=UPI00114CEF1A|nr:hypothetical protein [Paenibacillus polymyxa]